MPYKSESICENWALSLAERKTANRADVEIFRSAFNGKHALTSTSDEFEIRLKWFLGYKDFLTF